MRLNRKADFLEFKVSATHRKIYTQSISVYKHRLDNDSILSFFYYFWQ